MGRAPCCDKVGLKKGPWTPEEDRILIDYIKKNGHGNWRALPKLAGLLRCGKSCRLRWINYLRPDLKRGNFTREEEDTIIKLHELLGNRWSAIAAKLPGRTDNEIKNVWHTHIKKKLNKQNGETQNTISRPASHLPKPICNVLTSSDPSNSLSGQGSENCTSIPTSPQQSSSEMSSVTNASMTAEISSMEIRSEEMDCSEWISVIDESFWSEDSDPAITDSSSYSTGYEACKNGGEMRLQFPLNEIPNAGQEARNGSIDLKDDMAFWYNLFLGAGGGKELLEF